MQYIKKQQMQEMDLITILLKQIMNVRIVEIIQLLQKYMNGLTIITSKNLMDIIAIMIMIEEASQKD